MIDQVHLRDYKAHRDTRLRLGRFTVLVGDNASGKTSVLDALGMVGALVPTPEFGSPVSYLQNAMNPTDLVRRGMERFSITVQGVRGDVPVLARLEIDVPKVPPKDHDYALRLECHLGSESFKAEARGRNGGGTSGGSWEKVADTLGRVSLYRLASEAVAAPAHVLDPDVRIDSQGHNTAAVLAAMKLTSDEAFDRVEEALRGLVPSLERLRVRQHSESTARGQAVVNRLVFDFRGAGGVPAHGASQGTLIVLALLTVLHGPHRPNLILLDDLDHALHPRAQMELVRLVKGLLAMEEFRDVQILATTHSPYVLDELDLEDIHVFALTADGVVASKCLSEHPAAGSAKGMLTPGQLWSMDPEREWVLRGG